MSIRYFDLTWTPTTAAPTLPTGEAGTKERPYLAPAIYRGDGYSILFTITDGVDPWVPEGTLAAQIRKERAKNGAAPPVVLATFEVTVEDNTVLLALAGDDSLALPDSCYWDLQESFPSAEPRTWYTGKVKAWGDVTRVEA